MSRREKILALILAALWVFLVLWFLVELSDVDHRLNGDTYDSAVHAAVDMEWRGL